MFAYNFSTIHGYFGFFIFCLDCKYEINKKKTKKKNKLADPSEMMKSLPIGRSAADLLEDLLDG